MAGGKELDVNDAEIDKILDEMRLSRGGSKLPPTQTPKPSPLAKKQSSWPQRDKGGHPAERIWGCFHCGQGISSLDAYVEIAHYVPHPGKMTHKHFHESCFEEVAGKEYM